MLANGPIRTEALSDMPLLAQVVRHKETFYPSAWARYDLAHPASLRLVPREERFAALERDYRNMGVMIFAELLRRMEIYVEEEVRAGRLPKGSFPLLREALLAGEFERGQAPALTAYKERMARSVLSQLLEHGLLVSTGPRAPVRLGFPIGVVERWFPALYPANLN
jgi:hypothetical protein